MRYPPCASKLNLSTLHTLAPRPEPQLSSPTGLLAFSWRLHTNASSNLATENTSGFLGILLYFEDFSRWSTLLPRSSIVNGDQRTRYQSVVVSKQTIAPPNTTRRCRCPNPRPPLHAPACAVTSFRTGNRDFRFRFGGRCQRQGRWDW